MRRPFLLMILLALHAFLIGFSPDASTLRTGDVAQPTKEILTVRTANGREFLFHVEVVDRPVDIMRGLTFREEMPADEGMLFVFPERAERTFWMRNTFIPLDVLFISDEGVINHIHHNAVPHDLSDIPSRGPVSRVLEINGGSAEQLGISVGDTVLNDRYFAVRGHEDTARVRAPPP